MYIYVCELELKQGEHILEEYNVKSYFYEVLL